MRSPLDTRLVLPILALSGCVIARPDGVYMSGRHSGWANPSVSTLAPPASQASASGGGATEPTTPTWPVATGSSPVCYVLAPRVPGTSSAAPEAGLAWVAAVCEGQVDRSLAITVQRVLSRLGYQAGAEDGIYGPQTSAAVERFKRDYLIYGDGLTAETLEALGIPWQRPSAVSGGAAH